MKTGTKSFIALIGLAVLGAWTTTQSNDLAKAQWLIGTWENKTQRGSIYETWSRFGNNEFSGKSYIVKENDTIVFETIRLLYEKNRLFYIPAVKNQNEGSPVRFTPKSISEGKLVFENPQHDFPQIISYTRISNDSMVAEISGIKNGQERKQTFSMKRVSISAARKK